MTIDRRFINSKSSSSSANTVSVEPLMGALTRGFATLGPGLVLRAELLFVKRRNSSVPHLLCYLLVNNEY